LYSFRHSNFVVRHFLSKRFPMYSSQSDYTKPQDRPALVHAVRTMPRWKWKILGIGLTIGCIGVGGQIASAYLKPAPTPAPVSHSTSAAPVNGVAPSGSSGFAGGHPQSTAPDATTTSPPPAATSTLIDAVTPFMSHFGFSLFVGIVVGLAFRTFLRVALLFSAIIVGGAMAISYFGHINIDMTTVKADTSQAVSWLTDQGYRLKTMLFQALPSSTAAGVGFLLGFKRR
jgi:uncharacterized membrane protein (Fun14 family)